MKTRYITILTLTGAYVLLTSCSSTSTKGTIGSLKNVDFEVKEEKVDGSLEKAMASYQKFLEETPETEMTPDITIYRRDHTGKVVQQKPAIPEREIHAFHRNLADHLLTGEPIAAPLADSVKVVSILEAAALSMANGGKPEVFHAG